MNSLTDVDSPTYSSRMAIDRSCAAFRESLRVALTLSGKPRQRVADEAGIHLTTLQRFISGKREPRLSTLFALSASLEIDPRQLIDTSLTKKAICRTSQ